MKTEFTELARFIDHAKIVQSEIFSLIEHAFELEREYPELDTPDWNGPSQPMPLHMFCHYAQDGVFDAIAKIKDFIADNSNDTTGAQ